CGRCEEVCPTAAIKLSQEYELAVVLVIMLMTPGMAISVYLIPVWLVVLGIGYLFKEKTAKAVKAH
ncbi:4Fe-4S binding domain protein, partial [Escherichia coli 97.1742]